jgi:putative phosphonate transport system ATP-binding protein
VTWLLRAEGVTKIFGPGCPRCQTMTGPVQETNTCPRCGSIVACADVSFTLAAGHTLGIVGESGSGKSTLLSCLYGDVEPTSGAAYLRPFADGSRSLFTATPAERRRLRAFTMGIVYQHPHKGLNLRISAGGNVAERLMAVEWRRVADIRERASGLLTRMEVPTDRMDDLPAFFSGGMQQRVQIAKAVANEPALLLLDEPTSGLDVSVQAGVLDLIREIRHQSGITLLVVSHDLGVIRLLTERTLVMKHGRVIEAGLTDQILEDPQQPYSQLLVSSVTA